MNKTGINNESEELSHLAAELRVLRKGSGLAAWKLQDTTNLRTAVAHHLDEEPQALSIEQVYAYLLHEIKELGNNDSAKMLRNAYAIGQEEHPGSLTQRRADMSIDANVHPDTVKAHENRAINALVIKLMAHGATKAPFPDALSEQTRMSGVSRNTMLEALEKTTEEALAGCINWARIR